MNDPHDFPIRCGCYECESKTTHRPDACRRRGRWYVEVHRLDDCKESRTQTTVLCQQCFDAFIGYAKATIGWGMEGVRAPMCYTCDRPIVRLANLILDVGLI